jgi:type VI secretion system protein ImpC
MAAQTDPLDAFAFDEETEGTRRTCSGATPPFRSAPTWCAPSWIMAGACVFVASTAAVSVLDLPVLRHPTADGDTDRRTVTEICLTEKREAEIAGCGLIPLMHRKNSGVAAFISAAVAAEAGGL